MSSGAAQGWGVGLRGSGLCGAEAGASKEGLSKCDPGFDRKFDPLSGIVE
jgi:hypothetical protein